jgi:hypothetical protein
MNSLDRLRSTIFAFLMLSSRQISWRVTIRYGLGFAAARRVRMNAGLEFGETPFICELP